MQIATSCNLPTDPIEVAPIPTGQWRAMVRRATRRANAVQWRESYEKRRRPREGTDSGGTAYLYATIKAHFGRDHSLYHNNALERRVWLWFRSGSSPLAIETLRGKCEREKRLCPLCSEEVESEDHFFCRCPQLADVRGNWKSDLIGELRGAANDREAAAAIEQSNHFTFTQYALGMVFGDTWKRAVEFVEETSAIAQRLSAACPI